MGGGWASKGYSAGEWASSRSVFESHNPIKLHFNVECFLSPRTTFPISHKWKEFELVEHIMQQRIHISCSFLFVLNLILDTTLCLAIFLSYSLPTWVVRALEWNEAEMTYDTGILSQLESWISNEVVSPFAPLTHFARTSPGKKSVTLILMKIFHNSLHTHTRSLINYMKMWWD